MVVPREVVPGRATAEGTAAYARRIPAAQGHFRTFRGLALSSIGLGTYLGEADGETDETYAAAIRAALAGGVNVVDSAINYRHQRSERAVGAALHAAIVAGEVRREEVVIATKGGYMPFDGAAPADPRAYLDATYLNPGLLTAADIAAGGHSLSPRWLADQLDRSRANLGVETIDVYEIHNPETQLRTVTRDDFSRQVRAAFTYLEQACDAGKIMVYGAATWSGFRSPPEARDYLPLTALVGIAEEIGGNAHRFRVIQAPYNLAMAEAHALFNQPVARGRVNLFDAARDHGLHVLTSATLLQGRLAKGLPPELADYVPGDLTDAQRAVQFARSTPGAGTALVGMASPAHAREMAGLARVPPLPPEAVRGMFRDEPA